jgi:hypothetical protein
MPKGSIKYQLAKIEKIKSFKKIEYKYTPTPDKITLKLQIKKNLNLFKAILFKFKTKYSV